MIPIARYTIAQMPIVKTKLSEFSRSLRKEMKYLLQSECAQIHIIFEVVRLIAANL